MLKIQKYTKIGYVIGPFRAETDYERIQNIRRAEALATELWQMGYVMICVHMNTKNMEGVINDKYILQGDMEILRRCDFAITVHHLDHPKMKNSKGSYGEIDFCRANGIRVYESIEVMNLYMRILED